MRLNSRGIRGTFHWGIFVTGKAPTGVLYHITNKSGGWKLEVKTSRDVYSSMSLVLIFKIGPVSSTSTLDQVLRGLKSDGSPSARTGEPTTCRVWVKDGLCALHDNKVVKMSSSIDNIEREAFAIGTRLEPGVEQGGQPEISECQS
ncbi:hypothetical protein HYALB_00007024 [Hymenoscyphus albidus]|uniref:Uncharacterized protein n=1 Tax=Hymenoscyphus albidus TaxID=595503 RepID=A0A9N9LS24_9HELO|nr:hypothetical protein HYALB_00007024 [Hymenoscyphus albidus]